MRRRPPLLVAARKNEPQGWPRIARSNVVPVGFYWGPTEVRRAQIRRPPPAARRHAVRKTRTAARGPYYEPR
jgi:hypothetical protein